MAFFFTKTVRYLFLIALFVNGTQFYLRWKSYHIAPKEFKQISAKSADQNGLSAISRFSSEMRRRYPHQVSTSSSWVPISAGGLHLKAQFLYADLTEYVALWTAIGNTSGRSGIHWANSSCTVLSGEVSRVSDSFSSTVKESFTQSQNFRHGQFESYVYFLKDGTTVACYGRGFIPASSVWTISGALANGDPFSGLKLLYSYSLLTFDSLVRDFYSATDYVKQKVTKMEL